MDLIQAKIWFFKIAEVDEMGKVKYRVKARVVKVAGECPIYKEGDEIVIDWFYINTRKSKNVCIHAFGALLSLLSAFLHGSSAIDLGIGKEENKGYLQCPDPGKPWTCGGTVLFQLRREKIQEKV